MRDQEKGKSNGEENSDLLTAYMASLLVLSAECEHYGYEDLSLYLDRAARELAVAKTELDRLMELGPKERQSISDAYMEPTQ